jgi:dTDP-4-amino-4,6-dideoxygalactose transaminase
MGNDSIGVIMSERKRDAFLPFGRPTLDENEIQAVVEVLRSGWISTGPATAAFQKEFADYVGASRALGLTSCTAGLFLALKVAGVGPGDEVLLPPLTFAATANVVVHLGARPVFVDVEEATGNIDPDLIEPAITPRTRAIIAVHLYGRPAACARIREIADRRNLIVVGDCAHATEARFQDRHVASWADIASFSFYATKNLTTGEGGMLVSERSDWMDRAAILSLHGMSRDAFQRYSESGFRHYEVVEPGYKFNLTDIAAALGRAQLRRIETLLERREAIWRRYDAAFADLPVIRPAAPEPRTRHARHLYTLRLMDGSGRDEIIQRLQKENIGVGVHFIALHLQPYYRETFGLVRGLFPKAESISDATFSIPMTPYLTDEDVEDVMTTVCRCCAKT